LGYSGWLGLGDQWKSSFDVARVKVSSPVFQNIDFSQVILSQRIEFEVRVMEEGSSSVCSCE
jgi:hypothetical protein